MKETWRVGKIRGKIGGTIVTDSKDGFFEPTGHTDRDYYGGNLVAESIFRKKDLHLIKAAPDLLQACQLMIKAFNDAPPEWLMTAQVTSAALIMQDAIQSATNEG